jgi:hypothetical protein
MANTYRKIAYRSQSQSVYVDMSNGPSPAKKLKSTIKEELFSYMPWAAWGSNNLLPQEMIRDIETCGILNSIIDGKARFAIGEGMVPVILKNNNGKKVIDSYVEDPEILDFIEANDLYYNQFGWVKDLNGIGNMACRFMLNGGKDKIVTIKRDDVTEIRLSKEDPNAGGRIREAHYSADWDRVIGVNDNRIFKIPVLNCHNPLYDLQEKAKSGVVEHTLFTRYTSWGKHYYSTPLWYAAYKWVKIAQGVPEMKAAMFENNMRLKYMVIIFENYWEEAYEDWGDIDDDEKENRRNTLYDEIDAWLVGSKNAYKSIYINGKFSLDGKPQQYIDIKPIEDTTKPGELLPDSAAANSEIAFAMLFNNAIIGGNQASGLYEQSQGGSNVRESIAMQVMINEPERKKAKQPLVITAQFNGWTKRLPGLDFITQSSVLTTLDTGAGSKPVNNAGAENKTDNNGTDKNSSGS